MAKRRRRVNESKVRKWSGLVDAWSRSGLSQREFCQKQGVSLTTFQYWRYQRKVREKSKSEVPVSGPVLPPFLPVQVVRSCRVTEEPRHGLTVLLPGGCRIEVGEDFNSELLKKLVAALESTPC